MKKIILMLGIVCPLAHAMESEHPAFALIQQCDEEIQASDAMLAELSKQKPYWNFQKYKLLLKIKNAYDAQIEAKQRLSTIVHNDVNNAHESSEAHEELNIIPSRPIRTAAEIVLRKHVGSLFRYDSETRELMEAVQGYDERAIGALISCATILSYGLHSLPAPYDRAAHFCVGLLAASVINPPIKFGLYSI